ncbi:hypothetical protein Smp_168060 [Schistosoma mansoni]|uniref:hypothetical protein n=1 Tax=Schistosoma mansoni TaxID=6183 RepID=UPI00022DCB99|nr:hypothetical protein Smp_168060 [Schistosoma mansoni]|eukprot:XP_018654233.1 hypothetical protein Smp_168060 [Schistosoma mansoni]
MNHLYEINQTSATHNKQWDLLKLLCKDKNVDEVNKKLDEIALQHKKEITVQQDIAKQRVIDQLYEIHKVAEEIDRTKFTVDSNKGLWQKVLKGHNRLFPNFLNKVNSNLDSSPTSFIKISGKQKEANKSVLKDRHREKKHKSRTIHILKKNQKEFQRPPPRPKTRLILSAPRVRRIRRRPTTTPNSTRSTLISGLTSAVGPVSQRKLWFLSRSYLELESQIRVERRKNRQQIKSSRSCPPRVSLSTNMNDQLDSARSINSRPSLIAPKTPREQRLRRCLYFLKIQQIELQEKINKFCDDISEFIKNSLNIDDKVVAGDALSISIS